MNNPDQAPCPLVVGATSAEITPEIPFFLYGYPHTPRTAEGVHDPLTAQIVFIRTCGFEAFLVSCDLAFVPARMARRIQAALAPAHVLIGATHTHSGPVTVNYILERDDPCVPPADEAYLASLERRLLSACRSARHRAVPATCGYCVASSANLGRHRHDPSRALDTRMPVLAFREKPSGSLLGLLVICAMHPTVLHEDSRLVSADFPGLGRQAINHQLGPVPVVHWAGACGDLSPRYVLSGNTFQEAHRIGAIYAREIAGALRNESPLDLTRSQALSAELSLPVRAIPRESDAERQLEEAIARMRAIRDGPSTTLTRADLRTAECDVFGAECRRSLSRAQHGQFIATALTESMPASISVLRLGKLEIACLPGEWLSGHLPHLLPPTPENPDAFVATLINGDLQGYIATEEALNQRWYEAGSALFDGPASSDLVARELLRLRRDLEISTA
jgi:hypothetical protein